MTQTEVAALPAHLGQIQQFACEHGRYLVEAENVVPYPDGAEFDGTFEGYNTGNRCYHVVFLTTDEIHDMLDGVKEG